LGRACDEHNCEKASQLTINHFIRNVPYEAKAEEPFRFGSFTTAGELYVETGLSEVGMTGYRRSLSLDSAVANVSFMKDGVRYERRYFVSYPANIMAVRFTASEGGKQNLVLSYAKNPVSEGTMTALGNDGLLWNARLDNNDMQYCIRMKALTKGGSVNNKDAKLTVCGADEVVFLISLDTDYKPSYAPSFDDPLAYVGVDPEATTKRWMEQATAKGFEALLKEHYADYAALFNRVKLNINNAAEGTEDLPITQRLANYRQGKADFYLEQLYYQFGRYLLIASSRPGNMPANLQGVWHNNVDGPWRVDYHTNINLQMNYWPACQTNLSECERPLFTFIKTLIKPGEVTARSYFGTRGWTTSVSANIFGFTSPLASEDMSWNFSPFAGPWLATHLWNYYDYTRDRKFLANEAYDIIKGSARFATDYLWRRKDGIFTAAPSTSPEHGPVDEGATFAHAVVREILTYAIEASKVLGCDTKERQEWENALKHIAPYKTGRYGQLMEWSRDIDDPKDEHRHVNHLFGLHPGHTISPVTTPDLAKASRVVLEHRGDGATGWSMGWKLNQWARLHDGNHAYKLYGNLLKNGTLDNLWDTHAPFQIDGNFGGTAGVTEMLLQSHMGFLHLLPALPDAWKEGSVEGLRARGNFLVNLTWRGGKLVQATVVSQSGEPCKVHYNGKTLNFNTQRGKSYTITYTNEKLRVDKKG
uniref:glycosyl hydrolase family 95 catalytic domain-containing protein n=1 Tax=Prevotella sp. TaxID=59823 RepID=UPI0040294A98